MSSSETTKNKLLDTMRKTKESSVTKTDAEETPKVEAAKPAAKPAKPAKPAAKKAPAKKTKKAAADPFQSARRVWPD